MLWWCPRDWNWAGVEVWVDCWSIEWDFSNNVPGSEEDVAVLVVIVLLAGVWWEESNEEFSLILRELDVVGDCWTLVEPCLWTTLDKGVWSLSPIGQERMDEKNRKYGNK